MSAQLLWKLLAVLALGLVLRLCLHVSSYQNAIANRVEVSTPVSAWKRAIEGVYLLKIGISPYEGDTFHEPPLFLYFYNLLTQHLRQLVPLVFISVDLLTAVVLFLASQKQLKQIEWIEEQRINLLPNKGDVAKMSLINKNFAETSLKIAAIYALSPYSILACTGQSTSVFTNLLTALVLYTTACGSRVLSTLVLALLSYQSFYPLMFIVPLAMIFEQHRVSNSEDKHDKNLFVDYPTTSVAISIVFTLSLYLMFSFILLIVSYLLMDYSWDFAWSTYGFLWTAPDLTPNIGLFWYFFTEMFEHFREFFLWTFQINCFIYVLPLSLALKKNAYFLNFILLIILSMFKPYPSISDFAIYTALLPQWNHLFAHMKQGLIVACMFISCSVLAPILWHLWIVMGTANSNFYFGVTLVYNAAQIFLVTDLLFAFTKREFYLENGAMKDSEGNLQKIELSF